MLPLNYTINQNSWFIFTLLTTNMIMFFLYVVKKSKVIVLNIIFLQFLNH